MLKNKSYCRLSRLLVVGFIFAGIALGFAWPLGAAAQVVGEKKVAVILFNFQNNQTQTDSVANVRSNFFTAPDSIAAFYKEFSYDKLNLIGEVFGWYTIGADSVGDNVCPPDSIFLEYANQAVERARASTGRDLVAEFSYLVLMFPRVGSCAAPPAWTGLAPGANVSGTRREVIGVQGARLVLVNQRPAFYKWTAVHEIGHHFGFAHNNVYRCSGSARQDVVLDHSLCQSVEYGDPLGVLGNLSAVPLVPGPQRWQAGWLADSEVVTIEEGNGARQLISIKPISLLGASPRIARVLLGGYATALYLEYNLPPNQDSRWGYNFYSMLGLDAGVRIYQSARDKEDLDISNPAAFFSETILIDADPQENLSSEQYQQLVNFSPELPNPPPPSLLDLLQSALKPGPDRLVHKDSGVAIYTRNVSSAGADVVIEFLAPKISFPNPDSAVSGVVPVQLALYGEPGELEGLGLYIDEQLVQGFAPVPNTANGVSRYDYSWNTASYSEGSHTLTARTKDSRGNEKYHTIGVTVTRDPADESSPPPSSPPAPNIFEAIFQLIAQIIQAIFQLLAGLFGGLGGGGTVAPAPPTVEPPPPPPTSPSPVLDLAPVQPEETLGFTYSLRSPQLRVNLDNLKDFAGNINFNLAVGYSSGAAESGLSSITVSHNGTQIYRCPPGVFGFQPLITSVYECTFSYPRSRLQINDAIQASMAGAARIPGSIPASYSLATLLKEYRVVSLEPTGGGREILPDVPTITSISPSAGPNGTVITITGAGFTPTGNRVSVGYGEVILSSSNRTTLTTAINVPNLPPPGVLGPTFPEIRLRIYVENANGRTAVPGEFVVIP